MEDSESVQKNTFTEGFQVSNWRNRFLDGKLDISSSQIHMLN